MKNVASIILGGGEGTRLYPLTLTRSKPAIGFGGKYRLIDIPLSHSLHAGCHKIFVLTQFLSSSLHHHIFQTYLQYPKAADLIEILTAEQKPAQKNWFLGTADAVRQNIDYLLEHPVEYFLILSGDQLYDIDFRQMVEVAAQTDADLVVAALPVDARDASRMGILRLDKQNRIIEFCEKPQDQILLQSLKSSFKTGPLSSLSRTGKEYLGSMGIYLFKRKALFEILMQNQGEDFGRHLIPDLVKSGRASAFLFDGYWEDIGTISTFYRANMALIQPDAPFSLHLEERPIFTARYNLPPTHLQNTLINNVILCDGSRIEASEISQSIIGPRSLIGKGSIVKDSYLMGNDYYRTEVTDRPRLPLQPKIGENCVILKTIIDKNASLGNDVKLLNKKQISHYDGEGIFVRDGIIIVPRGAALPDGFVF